VIEPLVQCAAGMTMHHPEYLRRARALCDLYDVHLVADEIAVGFGRTGTFFAHEQAGVVPDLLCLSKGLSGGCLPLSVVLSTDRIYGAFYDEDSTRGFLHSHSYTGNTLACRAALASLAIFGEDKVLERNRTTAQRLTARAQTIGLHPRVRDLRNTGMIWAFDVATEDPDFPRRFFSAALEGGLLLRPIGNTVYFMPPLRDRRRRNRSARLGNAVAARDRPMTGGLFVTGTDTGVGKTLVACALIRALADRGERVVGMKPVAAGAEYRHGSLRNDDVDALAAASSVRVPGDALNPYCLRIPVAPHISAHEQGITIDLAVIQRAYAELRSVADRVVVEGVGGFRVPLGSAFDTADLAQALELPLVLVVGLRLGCINHALLTADAIAARGLRLAGWVGNRIDPQMAKAEENVASLRERIAAPLLGEVPYLGSPAPAAVADLLAVERLL
jgi:dethiobiotin synthase